MSSPTPRVLMIAPNDPAGAAINLLKALRRHVEPVRARLVTVTRRYDFRFARDIYVPDLCRVPDCDRAVLGPPTRGCVGCNRPAKVGLEHYDEIRDLIRDADVIHFHILADEELRVGPLRVGDHVRPSTELIHHHHGHPDFRANPGKYRTKYALTGRRTLVSTPDLLHLLPDATWLPNSVPLDEPLYRPLAADREVSPVMVSHSPTRRDLKNTDELLAAAASLRARGVPIRVDLLENLRHVECLDRKRRSDLCFDHLQGYFGMSSLEALAQGVTTIAGVDAWNERAIREFFGCDALPWVVVREPAALEPTLARLATSRAERAARGAASRRFMETVWTERRIAAALLDFYGARATAAPRLAHG
ncbi:MAG: glycosyltransferase family 1 protein [Deltaproteobacteria bacterium]|nr:glycosyltransferase family 1 protein [Deltaproteobacteria bacterium]